MESAEVLTKRPLQRKLLGHQAALDPSRNIRETAARMRQHDVETGKLVERSGDDELRSRRRAFERESQRVVEVCRKREVVSKPLASAVDIVRAIERVEQDRKPQLLRSSPESIVRRRKQKVRVLHRVRQVD